MRLYQLKNRVACAGVLVQNGRVVKTAPVLKRYIGWRIENVAFDCYCRGSQVMAVRDLREETK